MEKKKPVFFLFLFVVVLDAFCFCLKKDGFFSEGANCAADIMRRSAGPLAAL